MAKFFKKFQNLIPFENFSIFLVPEDGPGLCRVPLIYIIHRQHGDTSEEAHSCPLY